MHLIVLTLARQPERWDTITQRLAGWPLHRWEGVDGGDRLDEKRAAICMSYAEICATVTEPTVIIQDDVFPKRIPDPFDGLVVFNRQVNRDHLCPKLVGVHPDVAAQVGSVLRRSAWACKAMPRLVEQYGHVGEDLL